MAGLLELNTNIDVGGSIKIKDTPNNTGSILLRGNGSDLISTRTNAQFITDLNLALKTELPVYTGSLGITKVGNDFRPVYGAAANTIAQGNDFRILNGQTAFGWGNHSNKYIGVKQNQLSYTELYTGDLNTLPFGNYVLAIGGAHSNAPVGIGISRSMLRLGARTSGEVNTSTDLVIGTDGMSFRNQTNAWRVVWDSTRFTQDDVNRWNALGDGSAFVKKSGDIITGAITMQIQTPGAMFERDVSTISGGWARSFFNITDGSGTNVDTLGHYGGGKNLYYGYIGGTTHKVKNAIRWYPDGKVRIGATGNSILSPSDSLEVVGSLGVTNTAATLLSLTRGADRNANMKFSTTSGDIYIGQGKPNEFNVGTTLDLSGSAYSDILFSVNNKGATIKSYSGSWLLGRDNGGIYNEIVGTSTFLPMIRQNFIGNNRTYVVGGSGGNYGIYQYHNDRTVNGTDASFVMTSEGNLQASSLLGTGTRMVVASSTGVLRTQEIPTIPTNYVTKNNDSTISLATTVLDLNSATTGASILYAGASSTNLPTGITGTAGGVLITANHPAVGTSQMYIARGENDALLYRNQSGNWNRVASRDWTNAQGFVKTDTTYDIFSKTTNGLVPAPTGTTSTRYLREDGTWVIPTNTTYSNMSIAEAIAGTVTSARLISAKTLADLAQAKGWNSGIFMYSTQGGIQTKDWNSFANGDKSIAMGYVTSTSGFGEIAIGTQIVTKGVGNYNSGFTISNESIWSNLIGSYLQNKGDRANLLGTGLVNYQEGHTVLGQYNKYEKINNAIDGSVPLDTIRLFTIGNGDSDITTSNAFEMYRDGSATLGGLFKYKVGTVIPANVDDDVLITAGWARVNAGGGGGTDFSYKIVTANYTVTDDDHATILVATNANITITFPLTLKEAIYVRVDNASTGDVNIAAPSATGDIVGTTPFKLVMNGEMVYYRASATIRRIKGDFIF